MKKLNSILWGAALIALGVIWVLNSINVININLFFDGWWTLFIIVPMRYRTCYGQGQIR